MTSAHREMTVECGRRLRFVYALAQGRGRSGEGGSPSALPRLGGGRFLELLATIDPWQSMTVEELGGGIRCWSPMSSSTGPGGRRT